MRHNYVPNQCGTHLAEQKQKPLSIDDVTMMIAGQIGQLAPMDKETANLFQQLAKKKDD